MKLLRKYFNAVKLSRVKLNATWESHPYENNWQQETRCSIRIWDHVSDKH